jgi:SAM-dependent MidA family methyltransferase
MSNSQILTQLLIDQILESPQQRITFAEYMDLVLYHPQQGYYTSGTVSIGAKGDFFTSPSLAKDFGELLAEQLVEIWEILDRPKPFTLVEMGAGSGLLAGDILQYLKHHHLECFNNLDYIIVEKAEGLMNRQREELKNWLENSQKISWKSWQEISDNSIVGCAFSNELVDAFPVHQVILKSGQLQEIYVGFSKEKLVEKITTLSTPSLQDYFKLIDIKFLENEYPEGYRTEVNLAALNWLETVAQKLKRGYLLTIDYGYTAQRYYHPQRDRGTLQCYFQHRRHNNPYINLGQQDITAHVDFTALERYGALQGLEKLGFTQQGLFLMALGLGDRLVELSSGKYGFQEVIQRRDALHQLLDPSGLGGFGVLVQAKGLTEQQKARSLKGLLNSER